jgi:hypothetical protein
MTDNQENFAIGLSARDRTVDFNAILIRTR